MHYPTLEQLQTIRGVTAQTAALLLAVMRGDIRPTEPEYEGLFPKTCAWRRACYHAPRPREVKEHALAELLDTTIEAVSVESAPWDQQLGRVVGVYANPGDPWVATLVRCYRDDLSAWEPWAWVVGCWGDLLEAAEQAYEVTERADAFATLPRSDNPDAYAAE